MKKILSLIILLFFLHVYAQDASAIYNPVEKDNNIAGIHILFTFELENAAKLVNTNGGDWGYVTIPIQAGDKDLEKWQKFMDDCARLHLIPIIRIATENYYKDTSVWRKPDYSDVLDFANFLNSLSWPTKNRYVILFNEVNRFDEWQGEAPSPELYADIVIYASEVFKRKNDDFFLITAGLDNASPNDRIKYMDNLVFLTEMGKHNPLVFNNIHGISSHSYPNPGFSQLPSATKIEGTATYKFERGIVESFSGRNLPVFITETGWDAHAIGSDKAAEYLKQAVETIWSKDTDVVAVTPFLLHSAGGPFDKFSFVANDTFTKNGEVYKNLNKVKGTPLTNRLETREISKKAVTPSVEFRYATAISKTASAPSKILKSYFKTIFGVVN